MVAYKDLRQDKISAAHNPLYRPDIDGVRAIAVLLVVIYHAFPTLVPGGFIGVDVFFVISGYLITSIIIRGLGAGSFSFIDFYKRRINRIFPALLIVLIASLVFGWFALFPDEYMQLAKHVAGGAVFSSNVVLWGESGYFDTTADIKPLIHLWSLGIEEQYYIVFPILAYVCFRLRFNFLLFVLLLASFSFCYNVNMVGRDAAFTFFMPHTRAWELLFGAFLACFVLKTSHPSSGNGKGRLKSSAFRSVSSVVGLGLVLVPAFLLNKDYLFPGWWAVLPCAGAMLLIHSGEAAVVNRLVLSSRPFVWIGLISYPLYLWHWPLLSFPRILEGEIPSATYRAVMIATALVLAVVTYLFVEKPLRNVRSPLKAVALLSGMACVGLTGYYMFISAGVPQRLIAKSTENFNKEFVSAIWQYSSNQDCLIKYDMPGVKDYGWWFCMSSKPVSPDVILVGSSFANHLYPAFANNESMRGNSVLSIGTCSVDIMQSDVEAIDKVSETSPCGSTKARDQRAFIKSLIEAAPSIKYAILSGLHSVQTPETIAAVVSYVEFLEGRGIKPIIFVPHVSAYKDLKSCFARPFKVGAVDGCFVPASERDAITKGFKPLIDELSIKHPDVAFFDQNDMYCEKDGCSLVVDGLPLFRDQYSHYSIYASEKLGRMFSVWAKDNAPGILSE
ncbi:acyltransferase family protein [Pseudomonas laurentiana]